MPSAAAWRLIDWSVTSVCNRSASLAAVIFVRGSGFGEGDAENLCRIDSGEKEPDHALGKDVRFA